MVAVVEEEEDVVKVEGIFSAGGGGVGGLVGGS